MAAAAGRLSKTMADSQHSGKSSCIERERAIYGFMRKRRHNEVNMYQYNHPALKHSWMDTHT
jgi:hypothetical protein